MGAQQLLKIESVPISFEYVEHKEPASLSRSIAKVEISRNEGKALEVKPQKLRLQMDSFTKSASRDAASFDNLSYTATAGYDQMGQFRLNVSLSDAMTSDLRFSQVGRSPEAMVDTIGTSFNPEYANYFPSGDGSFSISFDLSGLFGLEEMNFTPPDLELEVKEMPHVVITYVGGPLYVPKSSDPSYDPNSQTGFEAKA